MTMHGMADLRADSRAQERTGEIPVTIAICNYNGGDLARGTIVALGGLNYPIAKIMLVDDGSTDDSVERVRRAFPQVRIVCCGANVGCPNRARNRALREATTRYLFLSDNDIAFARDVLHALMAVMRSRAGAAVCTPRVLVAEELDRPHAQGHSLHYLCVSTAGRLPRGAVPREPYIGIGCGIQLVDVERARAVGLFNEDLVLGWGDDGEFHHRLRLAGYATYVVPAAHVFHRRIRETPRIYGYVRNRWTMMLQSYQGRTLLLAAPALLAFELLLIGIAAAKGGLVDYLRAVRDVVGNLGPLLARRRGVQALRRVPDRDLLVDDDIDVPTHTLDTRLGRRVVGGFNRIARAYWRVIRPLL